MNEQLNVQEKLSVEKSFASHLLRYVGVGLISGSIVHIGTLGGGYLRYVVLITLGISAFIIGTLMEKRDNVNSVTAFIIISVILSIGVGMVSGGTQHYLDGPVYASFLIPIGIAIGYFAFLFRDYKQEMSLRKITTMLFIMVTLVSVLYFVAHKIPTLEDHHKTEETGKV